MLELLVGSADAVSPTLAVAVLAVGMMLLAIWDVWREEVENWAIVALLVLTGTALGIQHVTAAQWVHGTVGAAVAFSIYLWLGTRGVMSGGDVKLSIVPAFILGAVNPLLAIWWVAGAIAVHQILAFAATWTPRPAGGRLRLEAVALPHVPAMAISVLLAVVIFPL